MVISDPNYIEMIDSLREEYRLINGINDTGEQEEYNAMGNDFDVAQAVYWFCHNYHSGQWSKMYMVLCNSQYKPGRMERAIDWGNSYYDILCEQFAR